MGAENLGGKFAFLATNFRGKSRNTFSVASDLMAENLETEKVGKTSKARSFGHSHTASQLFWTLFLTRVCTVKS